MKPSLRIAVIVSCLLVACLGTSVFLLNRVDSLRTNTAIEEVLYLSSPKAIKRMSLGYHGLVADIYWTRAVQYFGTKHHEGATNYDLLAPLLEITTGLDPNLVVAYQYGGNFLAPKPPYGAGMPRRAIDLIQYGIDHNPDDWRLYYQLGFTYYMDLEDYPHAADAFARGSKIPGALPYLKVLAAQMAEHAGDRETARMMWVTTHETTTDAAIRANAAAHIRALQVDQDITDLEALLDRYRGRTGHPAQSFADLSAAAMLRGIPRDPLGNPYKLTADGHVQVQSPDDFPFITKGMPPGYVPPLKPKFLPTD